MKQGKRAAKTLKAATALNRVSASDDDAVTTSSLGAMRAVRTKAKNKMNHFEFNLEFIPTVSRLKVGFVANFPVEQDKAVVAVIREINGESTRRKNFGDGWTSSSGFEALFAYIPKIPAGKAHTFPAIKNYQGISRMTLELHPWGEPNIPLLELASELLVVGTIRQPIGEGTLESEQRIPWK